MGERDRTDRHNPNGGGGDPNYSSMYGMVWYGMVWYSSMGENQSAPLVLKFSQKEQLFQWLTN